MHAAASSRKRKYNAADIVDATKTTLARLFVAHRALGKSRSDFMTVLKRAHFVASTSSLNRWAARVAAGGTAVSTEKATGASAVLSRSERIMLGGWVLHQNQVGASVHLRDYVAFAATHLGRNLSESTASRYLAEDGFAYRTMHGTTKGFVVDTVGQCAQLWQWVLAQRRARLFALAPSLLASVDFAFTGHRTERSSTFATRGAAQPRLTASISKYTNCIVTVVWADGVNRTPPMLFTYDPAFRRDRKRTARRDGQVAHLDECLARHRVDASRVVYVGKAKGEERSYVAESGQLLRLFFAHYGVPLGATVLSDNGNSFFEQGASVLTHVGFQKHVCYPAAVHQYLSPNDNRLHGTAKQSWRQSGVDHSDDVESSLTLLEYLDRDITAHSAWWFVHNMIELKQEDVEGLVEGRGKVWSHVHKRWLYEYRIWASVDGRGGQPVPGNGLDGSYWQCE